MPTVIIPPTDVSPNTGTGSEVLSNAPTLVNPIITGTIDVSGNITAADLILGTSGPSVKSTLSARAPRQGLVFDGTGFVTSNLSNVPAFGTGDFTFAAWVNQSSLAAAYLCSASAAPDSAFLYLVGDGTFQWWSNSVARATSSAGAFVANKWTLLVATRTGGTTTLYANGVSVGSGPDTQNITSGIDVIGERSNGTSVLKGTIAPLIYNRALSASEVVSLYEAGVPSGADYATPAATNTNQITGDAWWNTATGSVSSGTITLTSGQYVLRSAVLTKGKRYRTTYNVTALTGIVQVGNTSAAPTVVQNVSLGAGSFEFTANDNGAFGFNASSGTATINNVTFIPVGLLLAPDAAQAGGGLTWYDTSGNAANITLPASGVTWNVPTSGKVDTSWRFGNLTSTSTTTPITVSLGATYGASGVLANGWKLKSYEDGTGIEGIGSISAGMYIGSSYANDLLFVSNNTEIGRFFKTTGNLTLGAGGSPTDLGQKLQVTGTAYVSGGATFAGATVVSGTGSSDTLSYNLLLGDIKRLILGYDTTNDYGLIASIHTGVAWKNLVVNPIGGSLLIGMTAPIGSEKLQAGGSVIFNGYAGIADGITAPSANTGYAKIYVDSADGDLKVIFGDGTVKTIVTD